MGHTGLLASLVSLQRGIISSKLFPGAWLGGMIGVSLELGTLVQQATHPNMWVVLLSQEFIDLSLLPE
jgi:hypothetical protein